MVLDLLRVPVVTPVRLARLTKKAPMEVVEDWPMEEQGHHRYLLGIQSHQSRRPGFS